MNFFLFVVVQQGSLGSYVSIKNHFSPPPGRIKTSKPTTFEWQNIKNFATHNDQVWPITQFYSVCFLQKKDHGLTRRASNTRRTLQSFIPCNYTRWFWSRTLEGLLELTWQTSRALNLASYVASQTTKDSTRNVLLGAGVPC